MYITMNYSPHCFFKLQNSLPKFDEVGLGFDFGYEASQRELLEYLGIKKVRAGKVMVGLNSKSCPSSSLNRALERIKEEIERYISIHRERFDEDKINGRLEEFCLGEQLELQFSGEIQFSRPPLQNPVSREEARYLFKHRR